MTIPHAAHFLPEFMSFCANLAAQRQNGTLNDWPTFKKAVLEFFAPAMMDKVDGIVSGWQVMASYAERQTLHHVTSVLVALLLLPEYRQATLEEQDLMVWMVLFHDVAKVARPGKRDPIHAFRSAAIAGKALANVGFATRSAYPERISDWFTLTYNAIVWRDNLRETIQDNRHLPAIVSGLHQLYDPPAAAVIKAVLLHLSIVTEPDYPVLAPLTDAEYIQYTDALTHRLLRVMNYVDTNGWNLFDPAKAQRYHRLAEAVFNRLGAQIDVT